MLASFLPRAHKHVNSSSTQAHTVDVRALARLPHTYTHAETVVLRTLTHPSMLHAHSTVHGFLAPPPCTSTRTPIHTLILHMLDTQGAGPSSSLPGTPTASRQPGSVQLAVGGNSAAILHAHAPIHYNLAHNTLRARSQTRIHTLCPARTQTTHRQTVCSMRAHTGSRAFVLSPGDSDRF